jgi:hypothetical protein
MKLSLKAVALTTGLLWAGCILLVSIINLADPQYGVGFMALTNSLYPGLHFMHRWENLLGGAIYGFVDGAIGGLLFAWIYDHLVGGTHATNHPA